MPDHNYFLISVSHVDNHAAHRAPNPATTANGGAVHAVMTVPDGGRGAQEPRGTAHGTLEEHRSWTVVPGPSLDEYHVTDYGTKGLEIVHKGAVVWSGHRTKDGYTTKSTTIVAPTKLGKLLDTVRAGDEATPKPPVAPEQVPAARKVRTAKVTAKAAPKGKAAATVGASTPKAAGAPKAKRGKRAPSEAQLAALEAGREQRASQRAEAAPPTQRAAGSATPANKPANKPAKPAKPPTRKGAAAHPASGPRSSIHVHEDEKVLADVLAQLKKKNPAEAEQLFDALKRIWLGGGREKTIAWMKEHGQRNVVKAFDAWVNANMKEAKQILEKVA